MTRIRHVSDIVDWRMCLGCGACAYICPENRIELRDFVEEGIRPVMSAAGNCGECRDCVEVCPGAQVDFSRATPAAAGFSTAFEKQWGPVLGIWEGHANDPEIRFKGSSGGALTALAIYCIEVLGMHGVLHIAQDLQEPIRNRTRLSRTREDLIHATGSRYSPASVCNGLGLVESAPGACVVVGKPSEIAAVHNARQLRCQLDQKIGLTLSFFCAESPATLGTIALLKKMGIGAEALSSLRYRGEGWPGHFAPVRKGEPKPTQEMSYQESWAFLQAYRPWSVQLWPDATGELADISCGDPWYRKPDGANPGSSLVMARTERGQRIVLGAIKSGYLKLRPAEAWKLEKSQSGLLEKKASIWGRRLAMRLFGLPVTSLQGVNLLHCWLRLPLNERIRSIFGTARRILLKKLYRRGKIKSLSEPVMRAVPSDQSVGASPPNFVVRSFEDEN